MFTIRDICAIAIQIERNGEQSYRLASQKTNDAQLAQLLNWIADEERCHLQWFESLQFESEEISTDAEIASMGRSLLQDMMKSQTFSLEQNRLLASKDIHELLTQSISFEHDTIVFYEMLRAFIDEANTLEQLNNVIDEEHNHVTQLEKLAQRYSKKQSGAKRRHSVRD